MAESRQGSAPSERSALSGLALGEVPGVGLCIPNINTSERRRRLVFGGIELGLALVTLAALMALGVSRWWRLALLPVLWSAAVGFFQWRDRT